MIKTPKLISLDLTKQCLLAKNYENNDHYCEGINSKSVYLCLIDGDYFVGRFHHQWFGWSFDSWMGGPLQYDRPGTNASMWQAIWVLK